MGMRIVKSLGFGLKDLGSYLKPELKIGEFNIEHADGSIISDEEYNNAWELNIKENEVSILAPINDKALEREDILTELAIRGEYNDGRCPQLYDICHYDGEFGDKNFIQYVPLPFTKYWNRRDDSIDYSEFLARKGEADAEMNTEILDIPGTLFPYTLLMKGNTIEEYEEYWTNLWMHNKEIHTPAVPRHIYQIMKLQGLYADPFEAFMNLRPTIYTHWS